MFRLLALLALTLAVGCGVAPEPTQDWFTQEQTWFGCASCGYGSVCAGIVKPGVLRRYGVTFDTLRLCGNSGDTAVATVDSVWRRISYYDLTLISIDTNWIRPEAK